VAPGSPIVTQLIADLQSHLAQAQAGPQRQPATGDAHAQEGPQLQGWHLHLSDIESLLGLSVSEPGRYACGQGRS
jgi:hypothetical protein